MSVVVLAVVVLLPLALLDKLEMVVVKTMVGDEVGIFRLFKYIISSVISAVVMTKLPILNTIPTTIGLHRFLLYKEYCVE